MEDDFSQDELTWGTLTEPDQSIEYDGETLRMEMSVDNWFVWSTPNSETYRNIHVEVMVLNNDGAPNTAFGILCNQQDADESYYYLGFTPGGEYAIGLAAAGQTDIFLTNNDEWGKSDVIPRQADSYLVGADCSNGLLTLYVNGLEIDTVSDSTYNNGGAPRSSRSPTSPRSPFTTPTSAPS